MNYFKKLKTEGISLRSLNRWLIILAFVLTGLLLYATYHFSSTFLRLSKATDEYIYLQKAAYEMMEASDYLTEKAQRFAISGKISYLDQYFDEVSDKKRRETALDTMQQYAETTGDNATSQKALKSLREAMDESLNLMKREYYSMKLVIVANAYTDYPNVLNDISLNPGDAEMSSDEMMKRAISILVDNEYYDRKEKIRNKTNDCLEILEKLTHETQLETAAKAETETWLVRIVVIVQVVGVLFMVWLNTHLGVSPILQAITHIKDDRPIPVLGSFEFRYLASTYNKIFDVYKKSIENLSYKASHDELTRVYNRSGYYFLLSKIEMDTTFMLLLDVDNFKKINDTFGHEVGDMILRKIADTLKNNFRSQDYVCRIGGDEFVVLMIHSDGSQRDLIASKVNNINKELTEPTDGLPPVSVSVGIAHGKDAENVNIMFENADKALYQTKRRGKNGYTFFSEIAGGK